MPSRSPSRSRNSPAHYSPSGWVSSRSPAEEKEAREKQLVALDKTRSRRNRDLSRERAHSDRSSHPYMRYQSRGIHTSKSPSLPRSDVDAADIPNASNNAPVRSSSGALEAALGLAPMEQDDLIGDMGGANPDFAALMQRTETTPAQQAEMDTAAALEDAERQADAERLREEMLEKRARRQGTASAQQARLSAERRKQQAGVAAARLAEADAAAALVAPSPDRCPAADTSRRVRFAPVMGEDDRSDDGSDSDFEPPGQDEPPSASPSPVARGRGRAPAAASPRGGRRAGSLHGRGRTASPAVDPSERARAMGGGGGKTPKQIDHADPFVRRVLAAGDVCTANQSDDWMADDPACVRMQCTTTKSVISHIVNLKAAHGSNHSWTDATPATTKGSGVTAAQYERGYKGILACNSADFDNLDTLYVFYKNFPTPPGVTKRIAFTDYIAKQYYPALGDVKLNQHGQRHKHFSNWVSGMGWLGRFIQAE